MIMNVQFGEVGKRENWFLSLLTTLPSTSDSPGRSVPRERQRSAPFELAIAHFKHTVRWKKMEKWWISGGCNAGVAATRRN